MTPRTIVLLRVTDADRIDWLALAAAFGQKSSLARVVPSPAKVAYRPPSDPHPERSAEVVMLHAYAVESRLLFSRGARAIRLLRSR